jgi:large subunit ribosomal protein L31
MSEELKANLLAAHQAIFDGVLAAVDGLDETGWATPTGCPGWDVHDQLAHIVGIERAMLGDPADEVELPDELPHVRNAFGQQVEVAVAARRGRPPAELVAEARETFERRVRFLAAMDAATLGEPLDGPGGMRFKASQMLRTRMFDMTCHEQDVRRAVGRPVTSTARTPTSPSSRSSARGRASCRNAWTTPASWPSRWPGARGRRSTCATARCAGARTDRSRTRSSGWTPGSCWRSGPAAATHRRSTSCRSAATGAGRAAARGRLRDPLTVLAPALTAASRRRGSRRSAASRRRGSRRPRPPGQRSRARPLLCSVPAPLVGANACDGPVVPSGAVRAPWAAAPPHLAPTDPPRRSRPLEDPMKQGIHPEYKVATVTCSCGNTFETRATVDKIHVELCNQCHPFYTGKQKLVDTGGRVDRFKRRLEKAGGSK